jgi:hypothetical protein
MHRFNLLTNLKYRVLNSLILSTFLIIGEYVVSSVGRGGLTFLSYSLAETNIFSHFRRFHLLTVVATPT